MKLFDGAQFLKSIKEMNNMDFMEYFGGKGNLLKFMADFIGTKNFQTYIQKHFNVHLTPVKINNF